MKQSLLTLLLLLGTALALCAEAPNLIVEVTVYDFETNEPLIGVNIEAAKDPSIGGSTDIDGKATLDLLQLTTRDTLIFSYVGYKELRIPVFQIRNNGNKVYLKPDAALLQGVTVTANKFEEREEDSPSKIEVISREEQQFLNSGNTAEALEDAGGVFIQRSQLGGGSPVIRGFEANKVLIVVDGVRLNNAIFRNGHLQNVLTVDNDILSSIEVVYGPSAIIYGSDAIGGVLSLTTVDPKLQLAKGGPDSRTDGSYSVRYGSADNSQVYHFDVNYGARKWGFVTSLTYSDFNDLRSGSDFRILDGEPIPEDWIRRYYVERINNEDIVIGFGNTETDTLLQRGSGYEQFDFLTKVRYQPNLNVSHTLNVQFSNTGNIPRYDRLTELRNGLPKFAEWYYGPQTRLMTSFQTRIRNQERFFTEANITAAFQRIDEDRYDRRLNNILRAYSTNDVYVGSVNADFLKYLNEERSSRISYGVEYLYNYVDSRAGRVNINDGEGRGDLFGGEFTRYGAGGNTMTTLAAYGLYRWQSRDSLLTLQAGGRFTQVNLSTLFTDTSIIVWPFEEITASPSDFTWSAGFTYNPRTGTQVRGLVSTAFHSPNVDDFARIREKNGFITMPNPDLQSERAISYELTVGQTLGSNYRSDNTDRLRGRRFEASATAFLTNVSDAIVRQTGPLPFGNPEDTVIVFNGETLVTQPNVNAGRAQVYGFSGRMSYRAGAFSTSGTVSYTKGTAYFDREVEGIMTEVTEPLSHIPPLYGQVRAGYEWLLRASERDGNGKQRRRRVARLEGIVRFNGLKSVEDYAGGPDWEAGDKDGSSDNYLYAVPGVGTPAWTTYNLYGSVDLNETFTFNLAVENLLDLHYRPFASGISAPGRNVIATIRGQF